MGSRKLAVTALVVVALALLGATSAFAGEVTGSGRYIAGSDTALLHGKSDCAYSGLNDNYVFGTAGPGNPDSDGFTRTQSWGQVVRNAGPLGGVPGTACNPTQATGGQ